MTICVLFVTTALHQQPTVSQLAGLPPPPVAPCACALGPRICQPGPRGTNTTFLETLVPGVVGSPHGWTQQEGG